MEPHEDIPRLDASTEYARLRTLLAQERSQLAAERTFSAWIRTGLAGVGGGFALIRFVHFQDVNKMLTVQICGEILLLWGNAVFLFALLGFYRNCKKFDSHETDTVSMIGVTAIALVLILMGISIFVISLL